MPLRRFSRLGGLCPVLPTASLRATLCSGRWSSSTSSSSSASGDDNNNNNRLVDVVECPRDAMQGLRDFVPTADKIRYINALLKVGYHTVDFGSFVSAPAVPQYHTVDFGSFVSAPAVPQMRDTTEVLAGLDLSNTKSKLLVVVANLKGCAQATTFKNINYIGYPLSVSETFQKANTKRSVAVAIEDLAQMQTMCQQSSQKAELVCYISMAFGNPYQEPVSVGRVEELVERVVKMGVRTISLADTVGVSEPVIIEKMFSTLIPRFPQVTFGAHFHSGTTSSQQKVQAAIRSGCRRLDGAIGGMGGCPFAKSTLVGNVATESIVDTLDQMSMTHGLDRAQLKVCEGIKHEIFGVAVKELLLARTLNNEREFTKLCFEHFDRYDRNKTGFMELDEFRNSVQDVFSELGAATPSDEKVLRSFGKLDINGTGAITVMAGARKLLSKKLKELEAENV
ncbi:hydroxymethylglutaryl-CoA lyase, putative [Bodo saltans]|uniref:hydroxymethylglutaryl-CoA lyase n=1 Tax=Bodo saltans TaxID=75058 RepID=A0A0S4J0E6_BODSA|nr:hydroxymethylglutaryl-CoA lyase, putative [Bodo saltans]|eukprot:CUG06356.1 hydroxymethylglutaryl-CoA lyase, putative [Bodo saltans]